jgi:hypothetical protein
MLVCLHDITNPTLFTQSTATVLPAKTRLRISLAVCAVAVAGIFVSDSLEKTMPPPKKHNTEHPNESRVQSLQRRSGRHGGVMRFFQGVYRKTI